MAVSENTYPCRSNIEVPHKLAFFAHVKSFAAPLGLDEHDGLSVLDDSVVNFFALLDSHISRKFRNYFGRVKNVIAQCTDERHNQSIFCSFFSLYDVFAFCVDFGDLPDRVDKLHENNPLRS